MSVCKDKCLCVTPCRLPCIVLLFFGSCVVQSWLKALLHGSVTINCCIHNGSK